MARNAKAIQSKSRTHQVSRNADRSFNVVSGESGLTYTVRIGDDNRATCTCDWSHYRKAGTACGCSHVVSVQNFIAEENGRRAMAWNDIEDAQRQHRPTLEIGDGIVLTTRAS